jgi:hypothetical protein
MDKFEVHLTLNQNLFNRPSFHPCGLFATNHVNENGVVRTLVTRFPERWERGTWYVC